MTCRVTAPPQWPRTVRVAPALNLPGNAAGSVVKHDSRDTGFSPVPGALNFQALANTAISLSGSSWKSQLSHVRRTLHGRDARVTGIVLADAVRKLAFVAFVFFLIGLAGSTLAAEAPSLKVSWLEQSPPSQPGGVSWGVPWPRGAVKKSDIFTLKSAAGKTLPLQSWPLAYWPDGTIKWSGLASSLDAGVAGPFEVSVGASDAPVETRITTQEAEQTITINTGRLVCTIPRAGENLIASMTIDGREIARDGHLTCVLADGPDDDLESPAKKSRFSSNITKVTLEQTGPVRAVVKIEGMHRAAAAQGAAPGRDWLPFVVRLYFYAGQSSVRMVHTIVYDGDQSKDYIRALGVSFHVPFREEVQNRHVRFSNTGGGLWAEPVEPMIGRGGRFVTGLNGGDAYVDQIQGHRVPNHSQVNRAGASLLDQWAIWNDFKLVQPNADGFTITKRTNVQSAWLHTNEGQRASGLAFVGDVTGGLAVTLRNFWQSYPASLEIKNAASPAAELNVWLWSPDAPAMDMRHYDTKAHGLEAAYEDVQEGFSTATGVARTSELTLVATPDVPSKADMVKLAEIGNQPPMLAATPEYLHSTGVFGYWSLKDTSTPFKKSIEEQLDSALAFYEKAIEQGKWYGFWYYGNFMHSYDPQRHNWRYDVGGTAWDNSELGTDMWLWYSFLRSGRADLYCMAEAMTRNTGEIATYHLGRFKGLGTRHGVIPWGDGAKEARVGQAAYRRFYYYLSTDERTGDLMHEALSADFSTVGVDPMREAGPLTPDDARFPTRVRGGPDWLAFAGNWMTEWERTGDTQWRDKIIVGAKCLADMPYGIRSGTNLLFGYDPKTGQLFQRTSVVGTYNLSVIMGGAEVGMELDGLLDDPSWRKVWRQYCRLYGAPANVFAQDVQTGDAGANGQYATEPRLGAYAALVTKNPAFAQRAVGAIGRIGNYVTRPVGGPEILNPIEEARGDTNTAAQNSLTTIELLELVKDRLPTEAAPAGPAGPPGTRGGAGRRGAAATAPSTTPGQN